MTRMRTSSRWDSFVVILAVVAVVVPAVCGATLGAHATGSAVSASGLCTVHPHVSVGIAAVAADSVTIATGPSSAPAGAVIEADDEPSEGDTSGSAALAPPSDPRHGRVRI